MANWSIGVAGAMLADRAAPRPKLRPEDVEARQQLFSDLRYLYGHGFIRPLREILGEPPMEPWEAAFTFMVKAERRGTSVRMTLDSFGRWQRSEVLPCTKWQRRLEIK